MKIGIIGAGAWGTALAIAARRAGCSVSLWAHEVEVVDAISNLGENVPYLPGFALDSGITVTSILNDAVDTDAILLAVPTQYLRQTMKPLSGQLPSSIPLVICSKGIEQNTLALMSEAVSELFISNPIMVLSGPTFAKDVAADLPTAVTLAADEIGAAQRLADVLSSERFRPYSGDDIIGSQIGGGVKNVIAIACGIADGRGFGDNARAALITRGLAELTRLCMAKGGRAETMMGLSGVGDLVLTCTNIQSRNYSLGIDIGQGRSLADILSERSSVSEGVLTASATVSLAKQLEVDMPISNAVDSVLNRNADIDDVIGKLLARPLRPEGG